MIRSVYAAVLVLVLAVPSFAEVTKIPGASITFLPGQGRWKLTTPVDVHPSLFEPTYLMPMKSSIIKSLDKLDPAMPHVCTIQTDPKQAVVFVGGDQAYLQVFGIKCE